MPNQFADLLAQAEREKTTRRLCRALENAYETHERLEEDIAEIGNMIDELVNGKFELSPGPR